MLYCKLRDKPYYLQSIGTSDIIVQHWALKFLAEMNCIECNTNWKDLRYCWGKFCKWTLNYLPVMNKYEDDGKKLFWQWNMRIKFKWTHMQYHSHAYYVKSFPEKILINTLIEL